MKKLIALTLIAITAGCAEEMVVTTDLEGLKSMEAAWQDAFNAGDPAKIAGVYAADGSVLPPNGAAISGRGDVQAFWQQFFTTGISISIEDYDAAANGDVGYKAGTFTMTGPDGSVIDDGKYVEVWNHIDGRWQMKYDIFNSNRPLPSPSAEEPADDEAPVTDEE